MDICICYWECLNEQVQVPYKGCKLLDYTTGKYLIVSCKF